MRGTAKLGKLWRDTWLTEGRSDKMREEEWLVFVWILFAMIVGLDHIILWKINKNGYGNDCESDWCMALLYVKVTDNIFQNQRSVFGW